MSSSASETSVRRWASLTATAGIAAYAFPLIVPWHVLFLGVSVVAGIALSRTAARRSLWATFCTIVLAGVLLGHLPSPLAAAVVSASVLTMANAPAVGAAILAMNFSLAMTMQEIVADTIHLASLEVAAPALVAIAILLLARVSFAWPAVGTAALTVPAAWIAAHTMLSPPIAMAVAALPACGLAAVMVRHEFPLGRKIPSMPLGAVLLVGLVSWIWTPPRFWNETYVLMPEAPDAFEAQFFKNYMEALDFAGIEAMRAARPEDISPGSLLLLPWLTSPFTTKAGDAVESRIGELARERGWTVIVAGEHTNMGGAAERIEAMAGRPILRRDLTVPPGNTDDTGPLHVSDLREWRHDAILNRGASVQVRSPADRILIAGDGWWAEPDIGEWLWVGDYVWRPGERAGRLALAASFDIDGARWVVIGDNSSLVNSQLFADPRPTIRLLEMATLWPAFLRDIVVATLTFLLGWQFAAPKWRSQLPFMVVGSMAALVAIFSSVSRGESVSWQDAYVGESGFDERNFNVTLAENPALVHGRRLIRMKYPVSGSVVVPDGNSVVFMLVDGTANVGGVKLSECRRMGSLLTAEGPYLMDAQACRTEGSARVVIGTPEGAAAFGVPNAKGEALILLDAAFIARNAPQTNVMWLLKEINR